MLCVVIQARWQPDTRIGGIQLAKTLRQPGQGKDRPPTPFGNRHGGYQCLDKPVI